MGGEVTAVAWEYKPAPWFEKARCSPANSVTFFPERGNPPRFPRALCRMCPIQEQCLEWSLTVPIRLHGIYGGIGEKERNRLRSERRKAAKNA